MSEYMCEHGHLYMSCPICSEITRAQSEFDAVIEEDSHQLNDYLYDYYLDKDEREMREQEDSL